MKKKFFQFVISLSLLSLSFNFIVLPFFYTGKLKSYLSKNPIFIDSISGKDFLSLFSSKMTTSIQVGTPQRTLDLYISMDDKFSYIGKGYCDDSSLSSYKPELSSSFSNSSWYDFPFGDLRNMTIGRDKCSFYNDLSLSKNITLNDFELLYGSLINQEEEDLIDRNKICGVIGLKLNLIQEYASYNERFNDIVNVFKQNKEAINSTIWTVEFFDKAQKKDSKYEGSLIIGAGDKEYLTKKKIDPDFNIDYYYAGSISGSLEWMLSFSKIFYYSNDNKDLVKLTKFTQSEIFIDNDYISITEEYYSSIKEKYFNSYINKGICSITKLKEFFLRYQFIHCTKKLFTETEMKKFPPLFFEHYGYNYTFELNYKDLFSEVSFDDTRIIFMAVYDPWNPDYFRFGKNFMKKYNFMFNLESKQLGFVNMKKKKEGGEEGKKEEKGGEGGSEGNQGGDKIGKTEIKKIIWIIILIILIFGIIIGIVIGKKIWDKARKKRANELQDDYDYDSGYYNKDENGVNIN